MEGIPVDSVEIVAAPPRAVDHVEPERIAAVRTDAWFTLGALATLLLAAGVLVSPTLVALLAIPAGFGGWRAARMLRAPERWTWPDADLVARRVLGNAPPHSAARDEEDSLSLRLRVQDQIDALENDPEERIWRRGRVLGVGVSSALLGLSVVFDVPAHWSAALAGILATYLVADLCIARPRRRRISEAVDRLRMELLDRASDDEVSE